MSNKTYILLKDLPYVESGAHYVLENGEYICLNGNFNNCTQDTLSKSVVERSPLWFKEKKEDKIIEVKVEGIFLMNAPYKENVYGIHLNQPIHHEKYNDIKKAIEGVLNESSGKADITYESLGKIAMNFHKDKLKAEEKAFNAGKQSDTTNIIGRVELNDGDCDDYYSHKYPTFQDYKNNK